MSRFVNITVTIRYIVKMSSKSIENFKVFIFYMLFFKTHRELRNVKRYETLGNNRMAEINGIETNDLNTHRDNVDPGILTQKKLTNRLRATPLP